MKVSLVRILRKLHSTHRVTLLPIMGSLYGCTRCWRIVGYRCGDVTIAGGLACVANDAVSDLVRRVWMNGGRHASGH